MSKRKKYFFKKFIESIDEAVENGLPRTTASNMKTTMLKFILSQQYEVNNATNTTTTNPKQQPGKKTGKHSGINTITGNERLGD